MFIAKKIFRANIEEIVFFANIRISGNWDSVFYMLVASDAAALLGPHPRGLPRRQDGGHDVVGVRTPEKVEQPALGTYRGLQNEKSAPRALLTHLLAVPGHGSHVQSGIEQSVAILCILW